MKYTYTANMYSKAKYLGSIAVTRVRVFLSENFFVPVLVQVISLWRVLKLVAILIRNFLVFITPFVVFLAVSLLFAYVLKADFDKYLELLKILVWPVTLLLALFFFRKVVTYLFFSMNEFNFFGSKGVLKSVTDVIDERVETRFENEKEERKRAKELKEKEKALLEAERLKQTHEDSAQDNLRLAREMFENYKKANEKYNEAQEELDSYRRRERIRLDRIQKHRERIKNRYREVSRDEVIRPEKAGSGISDQPKGTDKVSGDKLK